MQLTSGERSKWLLSVVFRVFGHLLGQTERLLLDLLLLQASILVAKESAEHAGRLSSQSVQFAADAGQKVTASVATAVAADAVTSHRQGEFGRIGSRRRLIHVLTGSYRSTRSQRTQRTQTCRQTWCRFSRSSQSLTQNTRLNFENIHLTAILLHFMKLTTKL